MNNKTVIITGGSRGIGRESARVFLNNGANVIITGRNEKILIQTEKELNRNTSGSAGTATAVQADVTNIDDCRKVINYTVSKYGKIDILINNAGMSARGVFEKTDISVYKKLTEINFLGPVTMSRLAINEIIKNKGSIVFISTIAALKGLPGLSHYSSSKMPLTAFSESIRGELKKQGVHVGIIYVGFTENDKDKKIYNEKGEPVVLKRDKNSMSQLETAEAVYKSILKRKEVLYLSAAGKFASVFYRLFPRISEKILAGTVLKSPQYKNS